MRKGICFNVSLKKPAQIACMLQNCRAVRFISKMFNIFHLKLCKYNKSGMNIFYSPNLRYFAMTLIMILSTGCSAVNADIGNVSDHFVSSKSFSESDSGELDSRRAAKLVNEIDKIRGVNSVTVVITGRTALIGISVTDNVPDNLIKEIKSDVEKRVKDVDTQIKRVAVTAAPELVERITKMTGAVVR